jgi:3-dehydroquinate synthase
MKNLSRISVNLKERSYDIFTGFNQLRSLGNLVKRLNLGTHAVIITNPKIKKLYQAKLSPGLNKNKIKTTYIEVPDSEKAKSLKYLNSSIEKIVKLDLKTRLFIVTLGGGVVGDLGGFIAAVYKRGIPYIQIPTSLLAQVDSSIGGKVAVDLPQGKNLLGAFYQPRMVFCDSSFLQTLSSRQLKTGLAEVIKYGIIADKQLFEFLEHNYHKIFKLEKNALNYIINQSAAIKAKVVSLDEREEKGLRTILNYGHTIGHAIEAACEYGTNYTHGEAISVGMICAAEIAHHLKLCSLKTLGRIESMIAITGLPIHIKNVSLAKIMKTYLHDKKFINAKNRFVLPVDIGKVEVHEGIPEKLIKKVISERIKKK